jgi:hypothetical protein
MDADQQELVGQLGTQIGMIMEDASVMALKLGQWKGDEQRRALADVQLAAAKINALADAAAALVTE